ncbi:hypothetical protein H310_10101 [Aphanomyces invadans]|uniref:Uncharacterized protein n=1 Tax=Aphanomyces invadans TaxID=157072 RepID=A0A024TS11_9STRA|nr:hypothetical protein H310_10101 [Aphanomyces invadans]ETV96804.1 hypothetical protein H310_10101 [Aphanomyces invadans]|eukprot:XP_008874581.1 hypothetical protein H310_10101 [Aphanomyces invadans]
MELVEATCCATSSNPLMKKASICQESNLELKRRGLPEHRFELDKCKCCCGTSVEPHDNGAYGAVHRHCDVFRLPPGAARAIITAIGGRVFPRSRIKIWRAECARKSHLVFE